jgi:hypothetical protein
VDRWNKVDREEVGRGCLDWIGLAQESAAINIPVS